MIPKLLDQRTDPRVRLGVINVEIETWQQVRSRFRLASHTNYYAKTGPKIIVSIRRCKNKSAPRVSSLMWMFL
jgi:hypothetical protein